MAKRETILVTNILSNFLFQIFGMALAFLSIRFLIQSVGEERYGIFVLTTTMLGYFSLAGIGLPGALLKYIPEYLVRKDYLSLNRIVSSAYSFYILVGLVVLIVLGSLSFVGLSLFKISPENLGTARNIFLMVGLWAVISWPMGIYGQILMGAQRFYLFNLAQGIQILLCNSLFIVVGLLHYPIECAILVLVLSQLLLFLISHLLAHRIIPELKISISLFKLDTLKMLFIFSVWVMIMNLAGLIIYQSGQIIISLIISVGLVSIYSVQSTPLMGVRTIYSMILSAIIPAVSESKAKDDKVFVQQILFRGTRLSLSVIMSIMVVVMAWSYPLIYVWMGKRFADYSYLCNVLLLTYIFASPFGVMGQILFGMGEVKILGTIALANSLLSIMISLILVKPLGILGVVLGTFLGQLILTPFCAKYFLKKLDVSFSFFFRKVLLRLYAVSAVFYLIFRSLSHLMVGEPRFLPTIIYAGAGFLLIFTANLVFACEKEDRSRIIELFHEILKITAYYIRKAILKKGEEY